MTLNSSGDHINVPRSAATLTTGTSRTVNEYCGLHVHATENPKNKSHEQGYKEEKGMNLRT